MASPSPSAAAVSAIPSASASPTPAQSRGPLAGQVVLSPSDGLALGWTVAEDNSTVTMTVTMDKLAWCVLWLSLVQHVCQPKRVHLALTHVHTRADHVVFRSFVPCRCAVGVSPSLSM